jgi:hypothetical protein
MHLFFTYGTGGLLGALGVHVLIALVIAIIVAAIVAGIVYFVLTLIPPLARFAPAAAAIVFLLGLLIAVADFL